MLDRIEFQRFLAQSAADLDKIECVREHGRALARLSDRALAPFTVAIAGRMKAGKSTLLNAFIGKTIAVSDVEEATATINVIQYGTGAQVNQFVVHWVDGRVEPMPLARIKDWIGKSTEVIERVKKTNRLQFFAEIEALKQFQIVDTPGTGSAEDTHEDTARNYLDPAAIASSLSETGKADAIIYVVPVVGRAADLDLLNDFSKGRIPGSDAYNTVCVVHKWDGLETPDPAAEAERKAVHLKGQLKSVVAEVISISGPLALAAHEAPAEFWDRVFEILVTLPREELDRALKTKDRWMREPRRAAVIDAYPQIPWVSFSLLLRRLLAQPPANAEGAKALSRNYSGMANLVRLIEDKFFKRAEIIKLCQLLAQANMQLVPAAIKLNGHIEKLRQKYQGASQAMEHLSSAPESVKIWLRDTRHELNVNIGECHRLALDFDRRRCQYQEQIERLQLDLETLEYLKSSVERLIPAQELTIAHAACSSTDSRARSLWDRLTLPEIQSKIDFFRGQSSQGSRSRQRYMEHITARLEELFQSVNRKL